MVSDPRADHQPVTGASYVNLSTIPLCNTDAPLYQVNIAIHPTTVGLISQMLVPEVLCMCGTIYHEHPWKLMPALPTTLGDPGETGKEEQAAAEKL